MENEIGKLQKIIDESNNIVFFGGAGVSTESGIPDFRSQDGLYNQKYDYPPETILSHTFFMRRPEEFFKFYRDKMLCDTAKPNAAHLKLAEMEQAGKLKAVITQNIDNLHQMAGSKKVLELHGSVYRNHCMKCGKFYDFKYMKESEGVPKCTCGGMIKPDVVLYEEGLDDYTIQESVRAISEAESGGWYNVKPGSTVTGRYSLTGGSIRYYSYQLNTMLRAEDGVITLKLPNLFSMTTHDNQTLSLSDVQIRQVSVTADSTSTRYAASDAAEREFS